MKFQVDESPEKPVSRLESYVSDNLRYPNLLTRIPGNRIYISFFHPHPFINTNNY